MFYQLYYETVHNADVTSLFLDVLHTAWGNSRAEVGRRMSQWLSGARDRRSGTEPARRKRTTWTAATAQGVAEAPAPRPAAGGPEEIPAPRPDPSELEEEEDVEEQELPYARY